MLRLSPATECDDTFEESTSAARTCARSRRLLARRGAPVSSSRSAAASCSRGCSIDAVVTASIDAASSDRWDVRLATELDPAPWTVRADPGQLGQVLLNLVVNARDAMPNGGPLRIRTQNLRLTSPHPHAHGVVEAGEYVTLEVSDSGTGIDATVLPHLFEPFFTTKAPGKGTGLGLSTVYGIVRQSDGHIEVKSAVGEGTTFVLYFPRESEESAPPAEEKMAPSSNGRSATILLVEDDASVRELVRMMLTKKGTIPLRLRLRAVDRAFAHRGQSIAVTDVVFPGLNGREVADRLRRRGPSVRAHVGYPRAILRRGRTGASEQPLFRIRFIPRSDESCDRAARAGGAAPR